MAQRGRKSAASLAVVQPVEIQARVAPPAELTDLQASIWQQVVATKPADWFTADSHQLLIAYCKHAATAAVLDQQIDEFEPEWLKDEIGLARYQKLCDLREKQTRTINSLSRSMRLTQQSRYDEKKAFRHASRGGGNRKPWEG